MSSAVGQLSQSYLTVIFWPEGYDRERQATLLAGAMGTDVATMRLAAAAQAPCILGLFESAKAQAAVAALRGAGGDGLAVTLAEIEALGPTLKIKDLHLGSGGIELELWRGPPAVLDPACIDVLVRAHLSETQGIPRTAVPSPAVTSAASLPYLAWLPGGGYASAGRLQARAEFADLSAIDRRVTVSFKLDVHVRPPEGPPVVYQIDGDKFGFQVLGQLRGHSDNVNIDRMCELMVHLAPEVVVDPYFALWHPPTAYHRIRLPHMKVNGDDPAFAFYSRWAALVYRRVMVESD